MLQCVAGGKEGVEECANSSTKECVEECAVCCSVLQCVAGGKECVEECAN